MKIKMMVIFLFFCHPNFYGQEINKENWMNHHTIKEIRGIYDSIQKKVKQGLLKEKGGWIKKFETGHTHTAGIKLHFEKNKIRMTEIKILSEDSGYSLYHYYDLNEKLRFLYIKAGAINKTFSEYRLYFDKKGKLIWENFKHVSGPGYPFVENWSKDFIIYKPRENLKWN